MAYTTNTDATQAPPFPFSLPDIGRKELGGRVLNYYGYVMYQLSHLGDPTLDSLAGETQSALRAGLKSMPGHRIEDAFGAPLRDLQGLVQNWSYSPSRIDEQSRPAYIDAAADCLGQIEAACAAIPRKRR